jgi:hypothetical protein
MISINHCKNWIFRSVATCIHFSIAALQLLLQRWNFGMVRQATAREDVALSAAETTSRGAPSSEAIAPRRFGLPPELWVRSCAFLDERDLFRLGRVNRDCLAVASVEALWKEHCRRRWRGRVNVARFGRSADAGGREDGRVPYCVALRQQFRDEAALPALNMSALRHAPTSWKEAYILAELDSRRRFISRDEVVHFKWQLIYNGAPSKMGLRKFDANGNYSSPYMGMCEWQLHGNHLMFAGISLLVERNADTCECLLRLLSTFCSWTKGEYS